jgi:hypothetical protein
VRRTQLLGNSQEKKKIYIVIRKNLQVNPAIKKHQVFKPHDQEILGQPAIRKHQEIQPCNKKNEKNHSI